MLEVRRLRLAVQVKKRILLKNALEICFCTRICFSHVAFIINFLQLAKAFLLPNWFSGLAGFPTKSSEDLSAEIMRICREPRDAICSRRQGNTIEVANTEICNNKYKNTN